MTHAIQLLGTVAAGILLLLLSTLVFDVLHWQLHRWMHSSFPLLRRLGALHDVHHRFLDRNLQLHYELVNSNVLCHVVPEFLVQVTVTGALGIAFFDWGALYAAWGLETLVFLLILKPTPGIDINHRPVDRLLAYRPLYFCVPEYHLLHHAYPDSCFSSWIKTLDHLLGTGLALDGRRIFPQGSHPALPALLPQLTSEGMCISENFRLSPAPGDILLLCPGSEDGTASTAAEEFVRLHRDDRIPAEIWIMSDSLNHTTYVPDSDMIIYRHLLLAGDKANHANVKRLVNNLRRGFNFVPARFDRNTIRNYWQFVTK